MCYVVRIAKQCSAINNSARWATEAEALQSAEVSLAGRLLAIDLFASNLSLTFTLNPQVNTDRPAVSKPNTISCAETNRPTISLFIQHFAPKFHAISRNIVKAI